MQAFLSELLYDLFEQATIIVLRGIGSLTVTLNFSFSDQRFLRK